jgi:hypothetical protein
VLLNVAQLGSELLEWEDTYDTAKAHQAPGYTRLLQFLEQRRQNLRGGSDEAKVCFSVVCVAISVAAKSRSEQPRSAPSRAENLDDLL